MKYVILLQLYFDKIYTIFRLNLVFLKSCWSKTLDILKVWKLKGSKEISGDIA